MGYLDFAAAEVGYKGWRENHTKYWTDLAPSLQGQPWCFAFVSWCFWKAGQLSAIGGKPLYYCPTGVNIARSRKQWYLTPATGDLVFYGSGGISTHVEFVVNTVPGGIECIGGNTSGDMVRRRVRSVNGVMGYWRTGAPPGAGSDAPASGGIGFIGGQLLPGTTETLVTAVPDRVVVEFTPTHSVM